MIQVIIDILPGIDICEKDGEILIKINKNQLIDCIVTLKNNPKTLANSLIAIFGVHFPEKNEEFQIQYLLLSLTHNLRFRLQVNLTKNEEIPSLQGTFLGSTWYEREIFDMFGVKFTNALDLRRILTDYNFKHHPLRKDFAITGYEEVRYNPISQSVQYYPINLAQEYRDFDYETPWNTEFIQNKIKK